MGSPDAVSRFLRNRRGVRAYQAVSNGLIAVGSGDGTRLRLRGLMSIPEPAPDFVAACALFARARALFDQMNAAGMTLDTLSMGMSGDLESAVRHGATHLRIGTAITGNRNL